MRRTIGILFSSLLALTACGGATSPTASSGGGTTGQVVVGNNYFRSSRNGSANPAVDTITAGSSITWAWNAAGSHTVRSTGTEPDVFRNSVAMSAANSSYSVTFNTPGRYTYDCAIHGSAMTGVVVVQ